MPPVAPIHGNAQVGQSIDCPGRSSLFPDSGDLRGGNEVLISGSGFTNATTVMFGGVQATSMTVKSDGLIEAIAPPEPPGTPSVPVTVTTPGGPVASGIYTYIGVTNVSPNTGPASGGSRR